MAKTLDKSKGPKKFHMLLWEKGNWSGVRSLVIIIIIIGYFATPFHFLCTQIGHLKKE